MSAGQLRIIKNRIRSVDNTKKITRAMEMVSAAKLRRFQDVMLKAQPFTEELQALLLRLAKDQEETRKRENKEIIYSHPFLETRAEEKPALVLITADAGLCGSYNMDLINIARDFLSEQANSPVLIGIGKAGITSLKRNGSSFIKTFMDIRSQQVEPVIKELTSLLENLYLEKKIDSAYFISSHYTSASTQRGGIEKILPFELPVQEEVKTGGANVPFIFEPSPELLFQKLIPVFFQAKIRMLFLEAYVAEHTARMNAMHQATKNASEMIDSLVLVRNKVRQAIITKEIIEIVSGSRALKK